MKSKKKSEMLEVRLSHEDKQALQAKAAREGRTVSFVVRRLISDYLTPPETRSQPSRLQELFMSLKSKPKSLLATGAVCLALPFIFTPFASAEDISLRLNGEYTQVIQVDGEDGKRVRRFETEIHMESEDSAEFEILSADSVISISITTEEAEGRILLKFVISNDDDIIGTPFLSTLYDVPARIEIGQLGGEMFTLDALPKKR